MKILHTSDWHLGRTLCNKKRYAEFATFLEWLADTMEREFIEVLLIAGDIFDTTVPSHRAQELYYRFLCRIAASSCRHVVIIAGNHDSPTFLNAPRDLLRALDVHIIGHATTPIEEEVIVLTDRQQQPELIVCAVPYLRDRDIRQVEAGESAAAKDQKLLDGIRQHYASVAQSAEQKQKQSNRSLPIVAMGHVFTAGGKTHDGDGVRELYVGSLAHVTSGIFPEIFDYVALGHLHVPQSVGGIDRIRYSGSPLAMGFGEAKQQKSVTLVALTPRTPPVVQLVPVPSFQKLERVSGDFDTLCNALRELVQTDISIWVEVIYNGTTAIGDLQVQLDMVVAGSKVEILRIKNQRNLSHSLTPTIPYETLDDLSIDEVFLRCLVQHGIAEDEHPSLQRTYQEAVASLYDTPNE
ncbi:exonuclease SbcCD subunit D C-terminal domain-containing protein [Chrysiogenes arsenatis]|uniref:exonuclease SbcCD subunit D C-terminal domain-containing protein n=1 Tax=Chrysiogenes arsenatis TaxID=309797 RepID=UPI000400CBD4|nr:exonuclease SbcCD subunit D C-terminal domain-containing protein [Chrysiogenes arsenatis]